jgi:hypothetical protein
MEIPREVTRMTEVVQFPATEQPSLLVGPFEQWHVIVGGRRIPRLTGRHAADGGVMFVVDDRFSGGPFYGESARQVAYILAQALAIGSGYSSLEATQVGFPFAPKSMQIEENSL